jgi:hypothetical protein
VTCDTNPKDEHQQKKTKLSVIIIFWSSFVVGSCVIQIPELFRRHIFFPFPFFGGLSYCSPVRCRFGAYKTHMSVEQQEQRQVPHEEEVEEKESAFCEIVDKAVDSPSKQESDEDDKEMWGSNKNSPSPVPSISKFPDQSDLWKSFPLDHDPWVGTHRALVQEIHDLEAAMQVVASRPLSHDEIDHLKLAVTTHLDHARAHHENEDKVLGPKLRQRVQVPASIKVKKLS